MDPVTQASRDLVMTAIEAARSNRGEDFLACFADDIDFWFPGSTPISGHRKGLPAFIEYFQQVVDYLDQFIVIEVTNMIAAGEWVITEAVGHGVTKKGLDYDNVYCLVWQVRDGKIIKFVEYCDTELVANVLCA